VLDGIKDSEICYWMSLPSITDADAANFEVGLVAVKALTAQDSSFRRKTDGGQEAIMAC